MRRVIPPLRNTPSWRDFRLKIIELQNFNSSASLIIVQKGYNGEFCEHSDVHLCSKQEGNFFTR